MADRNLIHVTPNNVRPPPNANARQSKLDEIKSDIESVMKLNILILSALLLSRNSNEILERTIQDERKKVSSLQETIKKYESEISALREELESAKADMTNYKKKMKILESENIDLKYQLISFKESLTKEK
jgi:uncharacterized protein YlxW (UPF0749 family)